MLLGVLCQQKSGRGTPWLRLGAPLACSPPGEYWATVVAAQTFLGRALSPGGSPGGGGCTQRPQHDTMVSTSGAAPLAQGQGSSVECWRKVPTDSWR